MSDASQGPGWWLASDGKWYPPNEEGEAPAPGWWLASDGKWYPPVRSERPGPGWWLASDGKWYAPESRPDATSEAPRASTAPRPPAPPEPAAAAPPTTTDPDGSSGRRDKPKAPRLGRVGRRRRDRTDTASPDTAPVEPTPPEPAPVIDVRSASTAASTSAPAAPAAARAEVPMQDRVRPNPNEGLTPEDQIQRRNAASRADATVLAAKRAQAASRALSALGQLDLTTTTPAAGATVVEARPTIPAPDPPPAPAPTEPAPSPAAAPVPPPRAEPAPRAEASPRADAPPRATTPTPLLEVTGTADVDHARDQLAIFTDRVELRDRFDRVRTSIKADDIVGVSVQPAANGAILSVESLTGPDIAATGLRAEQAEEARRLILAKTRPARVASAATAPVAPPTGGPATARARVNGPELVGKLADLRRAGILTEEEYQQKVALVRRLAGGEPARQSTA